MTTKTSAANGLSKAEAGYLEAIADCLKEMASVMEKTDAEIRRLRGSSRRKLDETWAVFRRVQATL